MPLLALYPPITFLSHPCISLPLCNVHLMCVDFHCPQRFLGKYLDWQMATQIGLVLSTRKDFLVVFYQVENKNV